MPEWRGESDLFARIERQDRALAEQRRELGELRDRLHRRDEELREARAVSTLLLRSRVYRLLRALGRWGWLEHRIRRALQ
jgi:hypothetical protein